MVELINLRRDYLIKIHWQNRGEDEAEFSRRMDTKTEAQYALDLYLILDFRFYSKCCNQRIGPEGYKEFVLALDSYSRELMIQEMTVDLKSPSQDLWSDDSGLEIS